MRRAWYAERRRPPKGQDNGGSSTDPDGDADVRWDQEDEPTHSIEPRDWVPEPLHCRINFGKYFETAMASILRPHLTPTEALAVLRADQSYVAHCAAHGIDRTHTGLTGKDVRRLLDRPLGWCMFMHLGDELDAAQSLRADALLATIKVFAALDAELSTLGNADDAARWGAKAVQWATAFMDWFDGARGFVYLHIYACHLWRWTRPNDGSTQALERLQAMVKLDKRVVRRDRKTADLVRRDRKTADSSAS